MIKSFKTDLSIEQCKNILKVNRWKFRYYFSSKKNNFIKNYGNFFYSGIPERNSFDIFFFGFLKKQKNYTEIKGIFFIHPYTVLVIIIISYLFIIKVNAVLHMDYYILILLLPMILISSLIGLFSARKHPSQILIFLKEILKIEEIK